MSADKNCKVFLTEEDKPESPVQIRRFSECHYIFESYKFLVEKLKNIYPILRNRRFTIYWKDSDNDDVIISSNEELDIALKEIGGEKVYKLYITVHRQHEQLFKPVSCNIYQEKRNYKGTRPHHFGVLCDICNQDIWGFRYKCIQCTDYDLCEKCEGTGAHSEHFMIRIATPLLWKRHYGKRLAHHVNKYVSKASHCHEMKEENLKECPYKGSKNYPQQQCESPTWLDNLMQGLTDWATLPGECPVKDNLSKAEEAKESGSNKQHVPLNSFKRVSETHVDFLKNIGENISQLLDPLGIDVNVQVKSEKPTTTDAAASASTSTNDSQSQTIIEPSKFPGEGKKLVDNATRPKPSAPEDTSTNSHVEGPEKSPEPEGWTIINEDAASASSVNSPPSIPAEPSLEKKPSVAQEIPASPADNKPIYPSLPSIDTVYHKNPKIQRAVEAMMTMGFSNEGGWLTQLLDQKGGDISKVLDILQPVMQ